MTEKQKTTKAKFLQLLERGSKNLIVNFTNAECRGMLVESYASRDYEQVILNLIDPGLDDLRLEEWNKAIDHATALLNLITEERMYESNGPNFFKAMKAISNANANAIDSRKEIHRPLGQYSKS